MCYVNEKESTIKYAGIIKDTYTEDLQAPNRRDSYLESNCPDNLSEV